MTNEKTILLVCRGLSEIQLLHRLQPQPHCRYIVASDDSRVHLEMEKIPWVAEVCHLEQMESLYAVSSEVIKYLQLINTWLGSLGEDPKSTPRELLFWIRHCEGGMTTQRIQDLLLLIRSYQYLIDTYNINSIIILSHLEADWEDNVLIKVGQSNGLEVQVMGNFRPSILKARLFSWMKLLAREPYYIYPILRAKLGAHKRSRNPRISEKEVVLQICLPHDKFVEHNILFMKAIKHRGYDPVALLWRAPEAAAKFQQEGLWVEELETLVPMSSIWEAPYRVWLTWRQARLRRYEFLAHPGLHYCNIALGPLLWPSVRAFFWEELPQRYRLQKAAQRYFAKHSPVAIRPWGGGTLPEGSILLKNLHEEENPLIFYWVGASVENPYAEPSSLDLFLATGDNEKKCLEKLGVPSRRIVTVGLGRYGDLAAIRKDFTSSQSRAYLNIPQNYQNFILYDSNSTLRGYLTAQEQSLVTNALISFVQGHPDVALMIKPHPAHRLGWLESMIDYFSLPNVFLLDKDMLPYHALNAADLLVTKFSTIALEAMLFQIPVVSVILDGEERFNLYGDAVEPVNSLEDLNEILTMLVSDAGRRTDWVENQLKNQGNFLKNYFRNDIAEPARKGSEALDKFINKKIALHQVGA